METQEILYFLVSLGGYKIGVSVNWVEKSRAKPIYHCFNLFSNVLKLNAHFGKNGYFSRKKWGSKYPGKWTQAFTFLKINQLPCFSAKFQVSNILLYFGG